MVGGFFARDRDRDSTAVFLLDLEAAGAGLLELGWALKSHPRGKLGIGKLFVTAGAGGCLISYLQGVLS